MQAETLIEIVERKQRPKGRYVVLGDMNDAPTSKPLEPFNDLVNGLKQVEERGGTPNYGDTPPSNKRWTHRFKESGQPPEYDLFDQVWLSPELAKRQMGAFILRRTKLTAPIRRRDPSGRCPLCGGSCCVVRSAARGSDASGPPLARPARVANARGGARKPAPTGQTP
jgi:hypothetical protein